MFVVVASMARRRGASLRDFGPSVLYIPKLEGIGCRADEKLPLIEEKRVNIGKAIKLRLARAYGRGSLSSRFVATSSNSHRRQTLS